MSEALRTLFLELGFDIPLDKLEKAEKKIRETAKAEEKALTLEQRMEKLRKTAADERLQQTAKTMFAESKEGKAHAAQMRELEKRTGATKPLESFGDVASRISEKVMGGLGSKLRSTFPAFDEFAEEAGMSSEALGIAFVGAAGAAAKVIQKLVSAAFSFADAFAPVAEELRDTSREVRVTTDELQGFRHAAVAGGVGVERMNSGLATFGASLRQAERWGNGTTFMLRRLGIQSRDSNGHIRPTTDLMDEVAIAMEHIPNPVRRARVAVQLFGESGRRMLDILHTGPGGIRALRDEMQALGGGVSQEAIAASREYTVATESMSRAQDSLRSVLAVTLLPVLSWVVTGIAHLAGGLANLTKGTHVVQIALAALGAVGAAVALALITMMAPVVAPYLAVVTAITAVVLAMDDLITFVEGGDSAIGRLIDSLFGVGTATEYVHELRAEWEAVQNALEAVIRATATLLGMQADRGGVGRFDPEAQARRMGLRPRGAGVGATVARTGTAALVPAQVPALARVAAPGAIVQRTTINQTTHRHGDIHVHGITDPRRAAEEVGRILEERERARRDADHPVQAQE